MINRIFLKIEMKWLYILTFFVNDGNTDFITYDSLENEFAIIFLTNSL